MIDRKITSPDLDALVSRLVRHAYPELLDHRLTTRWSRISSFAEVRWDNRQKHVSITCDTSTRAWHEGALFGLLSHELSHPISEAARPVEANADLDVIDRGLGVYLATERVTTGRYKDQTTHRGRDRYYGYRSIRQRLTHQETIQLNRLLSDLRIVPSISSDGGVGRIHDIAVVEDERGQTSVGGYLFHGLQIPSSSGVKLVIREDTAFLYVNDRIVGQSSLGPSD
ncbi:MAG: hypothetical protein C4K49_03250 [Candidatus Thorarchaeota archaeon]|nr:MAG: hypothetical protein C4K49_03250 [Candidatus Thorarchaeota archaeon]